MVTRDPARSTFLLGSTPRFDREERFRVKEQLVEADEGQNTFSV